MNKRNQNNRRVQRRDGKIVITLPSQLELLKRSSRVAQAAHVRGNAAGVHGGAKPHYGTAERRALRREERDAALQYRSSGE